MIHKKASCLALFTDKHPLTHYSKLELGDFFGFFFFFCISASYERATRQNRHLSCLCGRVGARVGEECKGGGVVEGGECGLLHCRSLCV